MLPECKIMVGDCLDVLKTLPDESVHCCVTSPPYWGLRDYGVEGQLGLEKSPEEYVSKMVNVFREVRRVLRDDGTLWLNLGDSYGSTGGDTHSDFNKRWSGTGGNGSKQNFMLDGVKNRNAINGVRAKNLLGIPWRLAFALQADGWWLRQDIIWAKPNPMPESVTDRCTKSHEYLFLLSKSATYYYDAEAIKEPAEEGTDMGLLRSSVRTNGEHISWHAKSISDRQASGIDSRTAGNGTRNKRSVWTVPTSAYPDAHFATYPPDLIKPCILAGCPSDGTVLDPFGGSGTTGMVALELGRNALLIELNPDYAKLAKKRCAVTPGLPL